MVSYDVVYTIAGPVFSLWPKAFEIPEHCLHETISISLDMMMRILSLLRSLTNDLFPMVMMRLELKNC